jgi:hypothetical protein
VRTHKIRVLGFELHQKYYISIFYFYSSLSLGLKYMRKLLSLLSKGSISFEGDRKLYILFYSEGSKIILSSSFIHKFVSE